MSRASSNLVDHMTAFQSVPTVRRGIHAVGPFVDNFLPLNVSFLPLGADMLPFGRFGVQMYPPAPPGLRR
jgi:hypothetical protein